MKNILLWPAALFRWYRPEILRQIVIGHVHTFDSTHIEYSTPIGPLRRSYSTAWKTCSCGKKEYLGAFI